MPALPLVTVYEAVNETLKEVYLESSQLPISQIARFLRSDPPPELSHWRPEHRVHYRPVATLPRRDAEAFIARYADSGAFFGWRVLPRA